VFFFSSRRRHTRCYRDWSSDVCSSDLPQGTFELKYFFTSSLRGGHGSEVSAESVKEKIREIIAKEDARKPLSDQYIAELLGKEQIDIARRTVAKYRELMGILPSSKRKQVS